MKLVETFKGTEKLVKVYWCKDWEEYQCKVYAVASGVSKIIKDATYHTDDKNDAIMTARKMAFN